MLELLAAVPGVVVLHDFYLSSLIGYLDQTGARPGLLAREIERSHGSAARTAAQALPWRDAAREWPASRFIFENADAVIVHSNHARTLAERYYGRSPSAPVICIPMPQSAHVVGDATRKASRVAIGVDDDVPLLASFGFMADMKMNLEIIDAFEQVLAQLPAARLVFVGAEDGGDYGRECRARIARLQNPDAITITGFADASLYRRYLEAADVAVQLRRSSRGETSKSVLDCMAHGVPCVVNDYAAFAELPDSVVSKVRADAGSDEIGDCLVPLLASAELRRELGAAGRRYIKENHAPSSAARLYASTVRDSAWRRRDAGADLLSSSLAGAISGDVAGPEALAAVRAALEHAAAGRGPKLYLDVSDVRQQDHRTGIHRVVRNLVRELLHLDGPALRCVPFFLDESARPQVAVDFAEESLGFTIDPEIRAFTPGPNDVLLLLDSTWTEPTRFQPMIDAVRNAGGRSVAVVYDTIPLDYPEHCVDYMPSVLRNWLQFVVAQCDGVVCISKAVADDVVRWIASEQWPTRPALRIGHIPLGCDLREPGSGADASPGVRRAVDEGAEAGVLLMVGTLEPRKRHAFVLDTMEALWKKGEQRTLVVIGKLGWNVQHLADRIRSHAELGRRLFWFDDATDADLAYAYRHAERLVQASDAEGFGLPLIEAAAYGTPVVASDIPVFREVAIDGTVFFEPGSREALAGALLQPAPPTRGASATTWRESACELVERAWGGPWDYRLA
jgi:glycosyltransferase involved in cell wall biosynthesis